MKIIHIYIIISVIFLASSCIPAKKVKYLQDTEESKTSYTQKKVEYKLQSGDNLYISLSSADPVIDKVINPQSQSNQTAGASIKYKDIFLIDKDGYIFHKQFESVYVRGLSIQESRQLLERKIADYYNKVSVDIRLADSYVAILGEVNVPGRYLIDYDDKISVFSFLGMAGDLTTEANRQNIKIIRSIDDKTTISYIDITDKNIIENEFYYLMPNDVVYVEPLDAVFVQQKYFPIISTLTMLISTTTSIIVLYRFFK